MASSDGMLVTSVEAERLEVLDELHLKSVSDSKRLSSDGYCSGGIYGSAGDLCLRLE